LKAGVGLYLIRPRMMLHQYVKGTVTLGVMFECVLPNVLQAKYDTVLTSLKFCSAV